jgi:hypothetical protein
LVPRLNPLSAFRWARPRNAQPVHTFGSKISNGAVWSKFAAGHHFQGSCRRSSVTVRSDWSEFSTGHSQDRRQ